MLWLRCLGIGLLPQKDRPRSIAAAQSVQSKGRTPNSGGKIPCRLTPRRKRGAARLQPRDPRLQKLAVHGQLADLGPQPVDRLVARVPWPRFQARRAAVEEGVAPAAQVGRRHRRARAPPAPAARLATAAAPRLACDPPSSAAPGPEPRPLRYPRSPRPRLLRSQRHPSRHLHPGSIGRLGCLRKLWGGGEPHRYNPRKQREIPIQEASGE